MQRWGQPRYTKDADLSLLTDSKQIWEELRPLTELKEQPEIVSHLEQMLSGS